MDLQVHLAQGYLNLTYGDRAGYKLIAVDGLTGWSTMYAMTRALQIELGIASPVDNFGPSTTAQFISQVGELSSSSPTRFVNLLQCALWCKGYYGGTIGSGWTSEIAAAIGVVRSDVGLSSGASVPVKLMKSLLTMDAYVLLRGGDSTIRTGQQWLNGRYLGRADFAVTPCDGLFTRQTQQALMYALQYEIGMADGTANGNFGPGTQQGIKDYAQAQQGDTDGAKNYIRLFKLALCANGYDCGFNGSFDAATRTAVLQFQSFMEIGQSGKADFDTWAALLVSTGNRNRAVTGFDTSTPLNSTTAAQRYASGFRVAGRYLTVSGKSLVPGELSAIFNAGLKFVPIFQNYNNAPQYFTTALGKDHGNQAAVRARQLGLGSGATIYFAVDYDATGDEAASIVTDYFKGVRDGLANSCTVSYRIGIYGTRNVCRIIMDAGLAESCWVAGLSSGYSGNLGFPMPNGWALNQIYENAALNIDHNAVSVNAQPLSRNDVAVIPESSTAFDPFYWSMVAETVKAESFTRWSSAASPAYADDIVLSWLRSAKYADYKWSSYLPPVEVTIQGPVGQAVAAARASYIANSDPPSSMDAVYDGGDVQHMAATAHGVRTYGTDALNNTVGLGDLGGWALDTVQLWADCYYSLAASPNLDIRDWVVGHAFETEAGSGFGRADLWADVDGYLVGNWLNGGSDLGDAVRKLQLTGSRQQKLAKFLTSRFGPDFRRTAPPVIAHVLASDWPAAAIPRAFFLRSAEKPTHVQAAAFGNAIVEKLAQLAAL